MSEGPEAASARDELAAALGEELRGAIEAAAAHELPEEALAAAVELARALREQLRGPLRRRWYQDAGEGAGPFSPMSRRAYLEGSPIRGRLNPIAPPLAIEIVDHPKRGRAIAGSAQLGRAYEGPPHGVHGGWVAALFDEVLGTTQSLTRATGMTAKLTVRYRHVTPVEEELRFLGWVQEDTGRRIVARATCHAGDTLTADAEGLFLRVDFREVEERMRDRREQTAPDGASPPPGRGSRRG
jgi:acyl-coenzyme A thioesterase PaaI-like protein